MQQTIKTLMVQPFDAVVFGGRGDLAKRKLLPALYHLDLENRLPPDGRIIAVSRGEMSRDAYRSLVRESCIAHLPEGQFDEEAWARFGSRLDYVELDAASSAGYGRLAQALDGRDGVVRCFYLATAPDLFGPIAANLAVARLITPVTRLVLEKPLGKDLASAQAINAAIAAGFSEQQIYRIDHYLGKETVQNLMVLRFANGLFEPLWNRTFVDHVKITVAET
jgi:glucose-6-phosphate 1-dehydrogenase